MYQLKEYRAHAEQLAAVRIKLRRLRTEVSLGKTKQRDQLRALEREAVERMLAMGRLQDLSRPLALPRLKTSDCTDEVPPASALSSDDV